MGLQETWPIHPPLSPLVVNNVEWNKNMHTVILWSYISRVNTKIMSLLFSKYTQWESCKSQQKSRTFVCFGLWGSGYSVFLHSRRMSVFSKAFIRNAVDVSIFCVVINSIRHLKNRSTDHIRETSHYWRIFASCVKIIKKNNLTASTTLLSKQTPQKMLRITYNMFV